MSFAAIYVLEQFADRGVGLDHIFQRQGPIAFIVEIQGVWMLAVGQLHNILVSKCGFTYVMVLYEPAQR